MLKTMNRTLGGKITETSFLVDENNEEIYTVTFTRADNRDMTAAVDKEIYDRCSQGALAIFDIDIVMEKGGDINHYNKKLTKAKSVAFVGTDIDARTYKQKLEEDITYLRRYAMPLPAKKRKGISESRLWALLFPVILFGGGILLIAGVPLLIKYQISKGEKYSNFVVTTGEVIEQSSRQSIRNTDKWDINYTIEYEVGGTKYAISGSFSEENFPDISSTQEVIYNVDNPSEGYYAEYNNIAKTYLPGMQTNSYIPYILMIFMGIVLLAIGVSFVKS